MVDDVEDVAVVEEEVETEAETPDEQPESQPAPAASATPESQVSDKHEFDKGWQQTQQELANARRRIADLERTASQPANPVSDEDEEIVDPLDTIKKLNKRVKELESRDQRYQELENVVVANEQKGAYNKFMDQMDTKYGKESRNDALEIARKEAIERGFSLVGNDHPSFDETCSMIRIGYLEAGRKGGSNKKADATGVKPVAGKPKFDTGRSGKAAEDLNALAKGSPDEVLADMRKKGKFKNLVVDE